MESEFQKENIQESAKVEVIIPTLNEAGSIRELIQSIKQKKFSYNVSILVIDGGSSDNTVQICKDEGIKVIKQRGKGKGMAMREAVEFSNSDIVVFIDGDGTYSIDDLDKIVKPLFEQKVDMVVGTRLEKREKGSISFFNIIGNKLFNKTINFALNSKVTDSLTGYRALYKNIFDDLVLFSDRFEIEVEMTVEALAKGYHVLEVPISYKKRKDTETKLNPIGDGLKIAQTLIFILLNVNPLKFFGLITIGFILIGLYPASQAIYEKMVFGEIVSIPSVVLASLLFVTSAISLVLGLVAEILVRSRRRLEYIINRKR